MTEDKFLNADEADVFSFGRSPVGIDIMTKLKGVDFKETTTISTEINPLRSLFEGFSDGAILFREKVCEEAAGAKAPSIKKYGSRGISNVFSIAAIEKIRDLAWEVQQDLKDRL